MLDGGEVGVGVNMSFGHILPGNRQALDGGAMFGNVPKALWSQWVDVDEKNRIQLACQAFAFECEGQKFLLETGIGRPQDEAWCDRFGVIEPHHVLLDSLSSVGWSHEDIDWVILSHLHFDHAGGLLEAHAPGCIPALLFPKARFVVSQAAWERACQPHPRDRASFLPVLNNLLLESNRLLVLSDLKAHPFPKALRFFSSEGHTPGLLHTIVDWGENQLCFISDLIPATPWVHLPLTMGYDRFAEQVINEKEAFLSRWVDTSRWVFFTHDIDHPIATIVRDERGRFCANPLRRN